MDDVFAGSGFMWAGFGTVGEEVGEGELGGADRVGEVDVEEGVAGGGGIVARRGVGWRIPEGGPGLLWVLMMRGYVE